MCPEIFGEWLRRQGHRVIRTASSYWYNAAPRIYQAFPYDWLITPSEDEINRLLVGSAAVCVRYSAPLEHEVGRLSYHTVCSDPAYDVVALPKQSRTNVRSALKRCTVTRVPFERLADDGWALQQDTLKRQSRNYVTRKQWEARCKAATDLAGFEAWAALVEGTLAASATVFQFGSCCSILYQQSRSDLLRTGANLALGFALTKELIGRAGVKSVFYGLHSLDGPPTVDWFKYRLGYRPRRVRQRVAFHPLVAPWVNRLFHAFLREAMRLRPRSGTLAKAEGLVSFFLEGKLPLERQTVPDALRFALQASAPSAQPAGKSELLPGNPRISSA
jgi:hypothetical protein